MQILVIPDVHLKPWMFDRAAELLRSEIAKQAVCLMDIPDDWHRQFDLDLYARTFDRATEFQREFPDTLWCWGNHDLSYLWDERESGYSFMAPSTVRRGLRQLVEAIPREEQIRFIHRIDRVLFLHGGLTEQFVRRYCPEEKYDDVDAVISRLNSLGHYEMWDDASPLWHRPQHRNEPMYKAGEFLQMVGHTPVDRIRRDGPVISCDVFSTFRDRKPIGTEEFPLIDTETGAFRGLTRPESGN